jgi:hypothetical protein
LRGKNHLVGTDTAQHLLVQIARCPGDHLRHPAAFAVLEDQGGRDAGRDRFADGHHHRGHIKGPRCPQGFLIGAVHHPGLDLAGAT